VQALLDSWSAAKKRAGPLRKAIKPLMEVLGVGSEGSGQTVRIRLGGLVRHAPVPSYSGVASPAATRRRKPA